MLQLLLIAPILALHLLCVSVGSASPLVCMWLEWRQWRGDALAGRACRSLAAGSLTLLAAGALSGLLVGALLWSDAYRELLGHFGHRIRWGVWELGISACLMIAYVAWRAANPRPQRWVGWVRMALPLVAGTNLLYHMPLLFVAIHRAASGESLVAGPVEAADFRRMILEPDVAARAVSFTLAAFVATGVALMVHALRWDRSGEEEAGRAAIWGGRIALVAALLQIPITVWTLMTLPEDMTYEALGGDLAASVLAGLAALAALWLIHQLGAAALGDTRRRTLVWTAVLTLAVAMLLTGASRRVQSLKSPPAVVIHHQRL